MTAPLDQLESALARRRDGSLSPTDFVRLLRETAHPLCAQLPPRFTEVLEDLCMRLESSQLFSGDSCSFSDRELLDGVGFWIERARLRMTSS
ncbi:MAG: hypothetical protein REI94_09945 [Moraxellaceae bacterium]|nr:hypothetical protein [Moraxellaceae bacterium]